MAQPTISQVIQKIEVDNVGALALTPITVDADGNYVRELRVAGFVDSDNSSAPVVFSVRLLASNASAITIATPSLSV